MSARCRFDEGYARGSAEREVLALPPPATGGLTAVHAFRSDQQRGFRHLAKHARVAVGGTDVLELVRLAWTSCLAAVVESGGRRAGQDALVWMLEDPEAFRRVFLTSRLKVATERCVAKGPGERCRGRCRRRDDHRPSKATVRSVHPWGPIPPGSRFRFPDDPGDDLRHRFLTGFDDSDLGTRFPIEQPTEIAPVSECSFIVPVVHEGDHMTLVVRATDPQRAAIEADPADFARRHLVVLERFDHEGKVRAGFIARA